LKLNEAFMKIYSALALLAAGAFIGAGVHSRLQEPAAVHAQEYIGTSAQCMTNVPKDWGDFMGGSTYGLAFEDKTGTLRFILHPPCGSLNGAFSPPVPLVDLQIQRR
jgi:hypothetical protein